MLLYLCHSNSGIQAKNPWGKFMNRSISVQNNTAANKNTGVV